MIAHMKSHYEERQKEKEDEKAQQEMDANERRRNDELQELRELCAAPPETDEDSARMAQEMLDTILADNPELSYGQSRAMLLCPTCGCPTMPEELLYLWLPGDVVARRFCSRSCKAKAIAGGSSSSSVE